VKREQLLLDFERAISWLNVNKTRKLDLSHDSEGPYSFLLTFLPQLGWPKQDPRWEVGQTAALAFLSYEPDHNNFLLRRSVPTKAPLLRLSQTTFDTQIRTQIAESIRLSQPLPFRALLDAEWLANCTIGIKGKKPESVTGLPIVGKNPAQPEIETTIWGVLLFFERWKQEDYQFKEIGQAFALFMARYMNPNQPRKRA
jgi:hypothetical protein